MTKIDIFSGFLGAGKTTLIKKLISEAYAGEKVVLIENEFGDIGVDSGFLKDAGIEITEMSAGCICCTLVGDFERSLSKVISEMNPERILIEPSGVGKLSDVIKAVQAVVTDDVQLNSFTTVVDAKKCKMHAKNFGEFFINQIEYANSVILSHTQGMTQAKLDEVMKLIREHNTVCTVVTTDWDKITGAQIRDTMEHKNTLAAELEKLAKEKAEADAKKHEEEHHHDHDEHHETVVLSDDSHVFVVKEIDCPHCAATLVRAMNKIEGISNVHIDHEAERMVFDCPEGTLEQTVTSIRVAIDKALPEAVLCEEIPLSNFHQMLIEDIDCPHCAAKLAKAVSKIDGISDVEIDHEAELIVFACEPSETDRIIEAIKATIEDVLPEAKLGGDYKHECCCHEDDECECGHEHHHHHEDEECECGHEHHHHHEDEECECGHEHHHHHEDEECECGHEHHHHHEDEECECGHKHHHHHEDEECECGHEHHHHHEDEECECGHEHHHHHEDEECECGHEHHNHDHSHEGHHHADDIFSTWGEETTLKFTEEDIAEALDALDDNEKYGMVLRAKGIVESADGGEWIHFDYIPGEVNVRRGAADVIGKLCVIGAGINENAVKALFIK